MINELSLCPFCGLWSRCDHSTALIEEAGASLPDTHRTRNDAQVNALVEALQRIEDHPTSPREMVEIAAAALAAWEVKNDE